MKQLRWIRIVSLLVIVGLLAVACGNSDDTDADNDLGSEGTNKVDDSAEPGGSASGKVQISGSSTVEPITALLAQQYSDDNKDVQISVTGPGTGDGFAVFCEGQTAISDASRPIKDEEAQACKDAGIDYIELKIAYDGITVVTSPENTGVECLSFEDLYALIGPESTGFANWSDADDLGAELKAANAPYEDAPLDIFGPGEESGTYDSFVEIVFKDLAEERGQEEAARLDYSASPNDNVIVEGVAGSKSSLGWVGFAYFEENTDELAAVAIDGGDGCVEPTLETIADGTYPISRPLYIYVNKKMAADDAAVSGFVDFYMSAAGPAAIQEAGYVALPEADWAATGEAWAAR